MPSCQRHNASSYSVCFTSLLSLHAETVNIWSHLLGAIWFYATAAQFAATWDGLPTPDAAVIFMYLTAVALCFSCSTIYHVLVSHVHRERWQCIDHFGIIGFVWASSTSFVFFAFRDKRSVRHTYIVLLSFVAIVGLICLAYIQAPSARTRQERVAIHLFCGGLATVPSFHYWHTYRALNRETGLLRAFWTLVIANTIGGGIYTTKLLDHAIGDKIGMPDISHHIMHGAAIYAAWEYQLGLLSAYRIERARTGV
jgi:adiponectin receptor